MISNLRQLVSIATLEAGDTGFYPPMLSQSTGADGGPAGNIGNHFYSLTDDMTCVICPAAKYTGYDSKKRAVPATGETRRSWSTTKMALRRLSAPARSPALRRFC